MCSHPRAKPAFSCLGQALGALSRSFARCPLPTGAGLRKNQKPSDKKDWQL